MWCPKCFRKCMTQTGLGRWPYIQIFQHWIFPVDGRDKFFQLLIRYPKADATHAIRVQECKSKSFFIFCDEFGFGILLNIMDNERKGR